MRQGNEVSFYSRRRADHWGGPGALHGKGGHSALLPLPRSLKLAGGKQVSLPSG